MDLKVRKPHNQAVDEALEKGAAFIGLGGGLYLSRMRDLDGAFKVEPEEHNVFRITRTEQAVKKVEENANFAKYRKLEKKWKDLI
jgi:hypothetical protein